MRKQAKRYKENKFVLWFGKLTGWLPVGLLWGTKVYYEDKRVQGRHLPGPSILMSNHMAFWDFPAYLWTFYWQDIRFLVGEVLFNRNPMLNWVLGCLGCIRVERSASDFGFMAESLQALDAGRVICIFPQGRLPVGEEAFPYKPGVVMIALHTDAPIIPVYNDGNYGFGKKAHVIIGKPIRIRSLTTQEQPDEAEILRLTGLLEAKTYELRDELLEQMRGKDRGKA